jgi:hypothetical protein
MTGGHVRISRENRTHSRENIDNIAGNGCIRFKEKQYVFMLPSGIMN